jgi:hypothetical protein
MFIAGRTAAAFAQTAVPGTDIVGLLDCEICFPCLRGGLLPCRDSQPVVGRELGRVLAFTAWEPAVSGTSLLQAEHDIAFGQPFVCLEVVIWQPLPILALAAVVVG